MNKINTLAFGLSLVLVSCESNQEKFEKERATADKQAVKDLEQMYKTNKADCDKYTAMYNHLVESVEGKTARTEDTTGMYTSMSSDTALFDQGVMFLRYETIMKKTEMKLVTYGEQDCLDLFAFYKDGLKGIESENKSFALEQLTALHARMKNTRYIIVAKNLELLLPQASQYSFTAGKAIDSVYIFSTEKNNIVHSFVVEATNSEEVNYSGKQGADNTYKAEKELTKDLHSNLSRALMNYLKEHFGARGYGPTYEFN